MLMKNIGYGMMIAFLVLAGPVAAQDEKLREEMGQRIEILDVHTGFHFPLDPNSDFNVQESAAFSPDQKWVAFDAMEKGSRSSEKRLLLAKVDGSLEQPKDLGYGVMPSFSKDGEKIAYSDPKQRGVWFMNTDGEEKQLIDPNAWSITFSPHDNDVVAYMTQTKKGQNIKVHNLDSGEERLLLSEEIKDKYRMFGHSFQWSADGSEIVVCARPRHENDRDNIPSDAVIVTISTGEDPKIEVVTAESVQNRVVFHPITNEIYFSKLTPAKDTHRIFSINPEAPKEFRNPVYRDEQPDHRWNMICGFSRDGNLIAITSKTGFNPRAVDADAFDAEAQSTQAVAAKLKLARTHLKRGEYEKFVDELMGDEIDKGVAVKSVEENADHWLGTINYALSRAHRAKVAEGSVSFGTGKFGRDLTFVFDEDWELESSDLP